MPPTVVTVTRTVPTAWDLVLAVMCVALVTEYVRGGCCANPTEVAPVKWVPVSTTVVPPDSGPEVGVKLVMVGATTNSECVETVPPGVSTEIFTVAGHMGLGFGRDVCGVGRRKCLPAVVVPNLTEVAREVGAGDRCGAPVAGPAGGVKPVMVGAATKV